jgi:hypothetical protein
VFGRERAPRLVRLKSRGQAGAIVLTWDARGGRATRWRVLRSLEGYAKGAFDDVVAGGDQTLISDQARPGARDESPDGRAANFYTIFVESEDGEWRREARLRLYADDPGLRRRAAGDFETGNVPEPPTRNNDVFADLRYDTMKSRAQREHPSVRTDDVD